MLSFSTQSRRRILCFTFAGAAALLSGCGLQDATGGNKAPVAVPAELNLKGMVHGGQNPILGGTIQLYQVGTSGYSSAATPLIPSGSYFSGGVSGCVPSGSQTCYSSVTTTASGGFNITGDYTCTPGTYLYITAAGGSPQVSSNPTTVNNNITLGAALGLCGNLNSSTFISINEETTVAMAYALAQFSQGTTFGTTLVSEPGSSSSAPADNFATSSTNLHGLANAMAIAPILVNTATGNSPGNNSTGTASPEWWQVNLIANILAACVNSTGATGGSSPCDTLFKNVISTGGTAPADTLQAALDLALTPTLPAANISNLVNIIPPTAPFLPYPTTAASVTAFSIGIRYQPMAGSTALLNQPSGIAIDSLGNAWISNQPLFSTSRNAQPPSTGVGVPTGAGFVELTPTGVPIQAGATAGNYVVNSYTSLTNSNTTTTFGGQYAQIGSNGTSTHVFLYQGALVPSIDNEQQCLVQRPAKRLYRGHCRLRHDLQQCVELHERRQR